MLSSVEPVFPTSLLDAFRAEPATPAFEHGRRVVLRGEVLEWIRRLSNAMREVGLGPGRGLAVFTAVTPEAFAARIAAHVVGCRVVGLRAGYTPRQLAHVLGMDIDALLVDPSTRSAELVESAGAARLLSIGPCAGAVDLFAAASGGPSVCVDARPDDVGLLCFTSGSTGQPKGCAMTYRALGAHWAWKGPRAWSPVAAELAAGFGRYLLYGTLSSLVVQEFVALCLLGGGTAVIPESDVASSFPDAIERYRISGAIITVPRLLQMLERLRAGAFEVSTLRALMVSGSPITASQLLSAAERLGPVVYQGYGQTEAGSISMLTPGDLARHGELAATSVGRPHPEVAVSVRDEANEPVGTGQTGEIYVRCPYGMTGYWGRPEETSEALCDGWLRTRDLGYLDDAGFLHLVGRSRDVILVNALVVYAGPIEHALASHPDVDQAYVVAAPDAQTGEAVRAFIVPAAGRALDDEMRRALADRVRAEHGDDSVPKTITAISAVPVAASGKPDKRALLERLR